MKRVEYNGGADVFVGLSTDPQPSAAVDGISEGAVVIQRDTKKVMVFSGSDDDGYTELFSFS